MSIRLLSPRRSEQLRAQPLSFESAAGFPLHSYTHVLNHADFHRAAAQLLSWQVQSRAGLQVAASSIPLSRGTVVEMRLGLGPFAFTIPCRVTTSWHDDNHAGFIYATLPGHPECGEEKFELTRTNEGIVFTACARSVPGHLLTRMGAPLARLVQRAMTRRYVRMLDT